MIRVKGTPDSKSIEVIELKRLAHLSINSEKNPLYIEVKLINGKTKTVHVNSLEATTDEDKKILKKFLVLGW